MYDIIDMELPHLITEQFEVGKNLTEPVDYFSEAVFSGGKKTVEPLLECFTACKNLLMDELQEEENSKKEHEKDSSVKVKTFDPIKYWRNKVWRDLEDQIVKIFGFRYCEVDPWPEKYISNKNMFETKELNCGITHADRYPIEGIVTNKGFYDKSHNSVMMIDVSLGLIKDLDPDEILAVFLHEFGHSIDPALMTISYTETNILSKYLTDRSGNLTIAEKKVANKHKLGVGWKILAVVSFVYLINVWTSEFAKLIDRVFKKRHKGDIEKRNLDKIKAALKNDNELFDRKRFSEAFADNFARMYGYGSVLMRGMHKMDKHNNHVYIDWMKKESDRQKMIVGMTIDAINDEHKTDIHRIRSLMREYKADINDPTTPKMVKKALQQDLDELDKVLDLYLNNFSDFQNKVNQMINEDITVKEGKLTAEPIKESYDEYGEDFTESTRYKREIPKMVDRYWKLSNQYFNLLDKISDASDTEEFYRLNSLMNDISKEQNGIEKTLKTLGTDEVDSKRSRGEHASENIRRYYKWFKKSEKFWKDIFNEHLAIYNAYRNELGKIKFNKYATREDKDLLKDHLEAYKKKILHSKNRCLANAKKALEEGREYTNNLKKAIAEYTPEKSDKS